MIVGEFIKILQEYYPDTQIDFSFPYNESGELSIVPAEGMVISTRSTRHLNAVEYKLDEQLTGSIRKIRFGYKGIDHLFPYFYSL